LARFDPSTVSVCEPLPEIACIHAYTGGVTRDVSVPFASPGSAPYRPHLVVHLLLLAVSCGVSVVASFTVPGGQIGFLSFTLMAAYLYPLVRRWLRPKSGFWTGLLVLFFILTVAEAVGLFCHELQTTGFRTQPHFGEDAMEIVLLLLPFAAVLLSALSTYLLGWYMLKLCLKFLGRRRKKPVLLVPEEMPESEASL
jgi:hypothetical protein